MLLLGQVQATVHGRHGAIDEVVNKRVVEHVDMKVEDFELIGARTLSNMTIWCGVGLWIFES